MMKLFRDSRLVLFCIILAGCLNKSYSFGADVKSDRMNSEVRGASTTGNPDKVNDTNLEKINDDLRNLLNSYLSGNGNPDLLARSGFLVGLILKKYENQVTDSLLMSESYYLVGVYFSLTRDYRTSINYLQSSFAIRDKLNVYDFRMARIFYNMGLSYRELGDFNNLEQYELKSVNVYKNLYGEQSVELISPYSSLIEAYIELHENEEALRVSNLALAIAVSKPDSVPPQDLADLYSNLGVFYSRLADFSKARIYLEKSESIHIAYNLSSGENYINLLNSLANSYVALGLRDQSIEYYEKGVDLAMKTSENTSVTYNMVNSYAITLGNKGNIERGKILLERIVVKAKSDLEKKPQLYFEVLSNLAQYLLEFRIDNKKSLEYYISCMDYLEKNPDNILLKYQVIPGYSLSLSKSGESNKAIALLQNFLADNLGSIRNGDLYGNPDISSIKADKGILKIFKVKYQILWDLYKKSNDLNTLKTISKTSELIVSLLEQIRLNMNEEESKLLLGDKYRDTYFASIRDFNLLYKLTSDLKYLKKAFEYSEKSKVAGLLSSTRELKATQFHIPPDIASFELRLKNELGTINALIADEMHKDRINQPVIDRLNEKQFKTTRIRDSLILVFEHQYPEYYAIKYNTQVATPESIPGIVGRNGNYVNYLLSDTMLYIFVVNREFSQLKTIRIDSDFFSKLNEFRSLLSVPVSSEDASSAFTKFQVTGLELYKILIEPLLPYLISDKIIISPDNILSYIPFETLPTRGSTESRPLYRTISYLMEDFDISYTYSATFMAESAKRSFGFGIKTIAFAPNYPNPVNIDSVFKTRQALTGYLSDLPYARQEAEYVASVTRGDLYENSEAKESIYKRESGKFDIIHLAMHTLMNDNDPMNSTLIFSRESDSANDSYLKTYEIYGIPLKAKMVVLSSCNTGSGILSSGEGILSLARGFIYSGSQSVVMSMWEIEDRSGTEIVKMFYDNLKKGYSKSSALRRARIRFLQNSDQLRSHPYFWSALVVYGNDAPLYSNRIIVSAFALISVLIVMFVVYYWRKRRYC